DDDPEAGLLLRPLRPRQGEARQVPRLRGEARENEGLHLPEVPLPGVESGRVREGPGGAAADEAVPGPTRRRLSHLQDCHPKGHSLPRLREEERHGAAVVKLRLRPSLNWLLAFVPIGIAAEIGHRAHAAWAPPTFVFFASCLAVIPLAGW